LQIGGSLVENRLEIIGILTPKKNSILAPLSSQVTTPKKTKEIKNSL